MSREAAVELLLAHDRWLQRDDFRNSCIDLFNGYDLKGDPLPMAAIDWDDALALLTSIAYSSSEAAMLRLAASLAGKSDGTPLRELIVELDPTNLEFVVQAFARICARHDRSVGSRSAAART